MTPTTMPAKFALIIIGDEILSGRRQDKHFEHTLQVMQARGLGLEWVHYLGDDKDSITAHMRRALDSGLVVFSCGGIGATPDDHTRQSVAAALGVPVVLHPEAARLIGERCADRGEPDMSTPENQLRLKMGEFPQGADIVPNPYNKIPGFSVAGAATKQGQGRLFCLPGFPVMAWPMMEAVLDGQYAAHFHSQVQASKAMLVYGLPESAVTPLMEQVEQQFAPIKAFSLPSVGDDGKKPHIELGCKAPQAQADQLDAAFAVMQSTVLQLGGTFVDMA